MRQPQAVADLQVASALAHILEEQGADSAMLPMIPTALKVLRERYGLRLRPETELGAEGYSGLIATAQAAQKNGLTLHLATRATCQEHLEQGDDKRTEPFTAAAFGLDVFRLRRAVMKRAEQSFDLRMSEEDLQAIAAAYSEASAEQAGEKPNG